MKGEIIFGVIAVLFVASFFYGMALNPDSEFGGADGQAEDVIAEIDSEYMPWTEGTWVDSLKFEPPGGETESLLFALQAAIGALVLGYFFGYYKGKGQSN
ncbi:energy-coupling factor ABC transporter substrate-binding protein [Methanococcoides alaskense]|uniref:Cobalt transport protein CbiN n=1 Tax=Methanococcoides alaskense TaxID=325778 RepID=A0AA90Z8R8_9EURY|nr:energy-coupling factor ABC transporter substrate-binding protein [Methanococcoides alaskense]MDA0524765.1 energy-coupling factor ABC transporter substrate-binding protein [Methanococcoides alaskense]MDR6223114.1 cobalt/nickel transport protein [Methanococcoides alaskense]